MTTDTNMREAIKPCPWCGATELAFRDGSTYRWGVAECSACGASAGETRREYPDTGAWHADAIAAWNRRTDTRAAALDAGVFAIAVTRAVTFEEAARYLDGLHAQAKGWHNYHQFAANGVRALAAKTTEG